MGRGPIGRSGVRPMPARPARADAAGSTVRGSSDDVLEARTAPVPRGDDRRLRRRIDPRLASSRTAAPLFDKTVRRERPARMNGAYPFEPAARRRKCPAETPRSIARRYGLRHRVALPSGLRPILHQPAHPLGGDQARHRRWPPAAPPPRRVPRGPRPGPRASRPPGSPSPTPRAPRPAAGRPAPAGPGRAAGRRAGTARLARRGRTPPAAGRRSDRARLCPSRRARPSAAAPGRRGA